MKHKGNVDNRMGKNRNIIKECAKIRKREEKQLKEKKTGKVYSKENNDERKYQIKKITNKTKK